MFGYWPSFIPDTNDMVVTSTKLTLFTVILKDPSHKVKGHCLQVSSFFLFFIVLDSEFLFVNILCDT